ncbi:hypothetical protein AYO47_07365 [Planctomyces sp. SCGC AG-212-M04]|nr:hypothetical protein AYO47_07365 [Planctomyces sp. SCGC AG-212-M04]
MKGTHWAVAAVVVGLLFSSAVRADDAQAAQIKELAAKVQTLEERVAALEAQLKSEKPATDTGAGAAKARQTALKTKVNERFRKDNSTYSKAELAEIESLYQVANKNWRTQEARDSLKKLVDKYSKANRTGCAILYLGQMSMGEEKEKYLKQAISDFGDSYYGNGVQVAAFARFLLAHDYLGRGKMDEAKALFEEIRKSYPEAVDHSGNLLVDSIPK